MIEVIIHDKYSVKIIDIVHDLKQHGFIQGDDFEFAYHKAEYDQTHETNYNRHTVFRFKDASVATWFSLKYNDS